MTALIECLTAVLENTVLHLGLQRIVCWHFVKTGESILNSQRSSMVAKCIHTIYHSTKLAPRCHAFHLRSSDYG